MTNHVTRRNLLILLIGLPFGPVMANRKRDQPKCVKLRKDIASIHARLRQPYRNKVGERLKDRLWKLKTRYYKECR